MSDDSYDKTTQDSPIEGSEKEERGSDSIEPIPSTEGWTIVIAGLNEEVREEDVKDKFADFGDISEFHMPLARATGYVKGYALLKFRQRDSAEKAIDSLNGKSWMDKTLTIDFAFKDGPISKN